MRVAYGARLLIAERGDASARRLLRAAARWCHYIDYGSQCAEPRSALGSGVCHGHRLNDQVL